MDTTQLLQAVQTLHVVKSLFASSPNEWLPVVAAIGGALVGGISTLVPSHVLEQRRRRIEKQAVSNALLAEVRGIAAIVGHRNYVEGIRAVVDHLRDKPKGVYKFSVRIPEHYSRVYQAHVDRLGILDVEFAAKIIEFHQLLESVVQDIGPGGLIAEEGGDYRSFSELLVLSEAAVALGAQLTSTAGMPSSAISKKLSVVT